MEVLEVPNLVKDLDLTLQPRIAPRYKSWLPLGTQQLRLRNLVQIVGYNLNANASCDNCWFYYTLHRSSMSCPIYTSEAIDNINPRWASLEVPTLYATGYSTASEIVLRLWMRTVGSNALDKTVFTWGIAFTGLVYIGLKLPNNLETMLRENSLIFHFHGGFFTPPYCFIMKPDLRRYLYINVNSLEIKESYTVNKLTSLRSKMQALKQQTESVQSLQLRIASGDNFPTPKYPQSSLNRLLQPRKVNREKKAEIIKIRKELEMARFRTKLLEQERARKMGELRMLSQEHATIMEKNQDHGSDLMERYRELNKDIERLHDWRQNHGDSREIYVQMCNQLAHRRRQLLSELSLIYPIRQDGNGKFIINNIHLPDSEDLELSNDTQVAVALGFVAHTTQMIANFLNIPTRYPIIHYGSRSKVVDHITESLPENERQFPLFARSKDRLQFHYAVYLLNKNIAQLRWYCGLPTTDLRSTLSNLATLINVKPNHSQFDNSKRTFSTSSLDTEVGNSKHTISYTPSMQKTIFEKCHRSSHSLSQLKTTKSSLGSSLDQGLDKPIQTLVLSKQSKRICKSEESAIDNKAVTVLRDKLSTSSNETLNGCILSTTGEPDMGTCNISQTCSDIVIENNIEIMIPTSVTKSRNATDSLENSGSIRDRSSNSISSCEMALSGSQNDGDESSYDNNITKREEISENVFVTDDNLTAFEDILDNTFKSNKSTTKYTIEEKDSKDRHNCRTLPYQQSSDVLSKPQDSQNSACTKESFAKSCLSLDDIMACTYEEIRPKQRASSISSYSEKCPARESVVSAKKYSSPPLSDEEDSSFHFAAIPQLEKTSNLIPKVSTMMPETNGRTTQLYEKENVQHDFQASSEYMDIIRRSSENVCARTEALANKKTSFKVMKPRL